MSGRAGRRGLDDRGIVILMVDEKMPPSAGKLIVKVCAILCTYMDRVKRIWYLSPMRAAKVQASLRIRAVSPEPPLLAHTITESRGTFRQKARSLAPLNGWACAVEICHDEMLEDTNSLDGAHMAVTLLVILSLPASCCQPDSSHVTRKPVFRVIIVIIIIISIF